MSTITNDVAALLIWAGASNPCTHRDCLARTLKELRAALVRDEAYERIADVDSAINIVNALPTVEEVAQHVDRDGQ